MSLIAQALNPGLETALLKEGSGRHGPPHLSPVQTQPWATRAWPWPSPALPPAQQEPCFSFGLEEDLVDSWPP